MQAAGGEDALGGREDLLAPVLGGRSIESLEVDAPAREATVQEILKGTDVIAAHHRSPDRVHGSTPAGKYLADRFFVALECPHVYVTQGQPEFECEATARG